MDTETTKVLKSCPSPSRTCSYDEQGMKRFVETKIHETQKSEFGFWLRLGAFFVPFIISFFLWNINLEKRVNRVEFAQTKLTEIESDQKEIKNDVKSVARELIKLTIDTEKIKTEIMRK